MPSKDSTGEQPSIGLKRSRATSSCTRCRKQKVRCSGEVPCVRCVRRNEKDSCQLWHRTAGRPNHAALTLPPCAYYSACLGKVSSNLAAHGQPMSDLVVQMARLWLLVAVQQNGADKQLAKAQIAKSTKVPLASLRPFKVSQSRCLQAPSLNACACSVPCAWLSGLSTTHSLVDAGRTSS